MNADLSARTLDTNTDAAPAHLANWIGGVRRESVSPTYLDIIDPCTGETYLKAPESSSGDIDAACASAKAAFDEWRAATPGVRAAALEELARRVWADREMFVVAECRNTGKPTAAMAFEVEFVVDYLRFCASLARYTPGLAAGEYASGIYSTVRREPVGVCAQVAPWNYPLMMAAWKIGPAIATGNSLVLKPSETTPVTALMLAELSAGILPAGVLNVVSGSRETGRRLVAHPIPQLVSATGSVRTGIEISESVAPSLKRVHLELGGKAPAIVLADADVGRAATELATAVVENAGQNCIAATRVLVARDVATPFRDAFVTAMRRKRYGAPHECDIDYGPLNSQQHLERVEGFVARLPERAEILTGGSADRRDGGYYFEPTVIDGLEQDDEAVQSEIFAPVAVLQRWDDLETAVAMANDVPYGLAASIWTESHRAAITLAGRLEAGQITINGHGFQAPELPNGGYKSSGHGNDMSVFAVDDYTRVKHVASVL